MSTERPTTMVRDLDGHPLDRDEYAEALTLESQAATLNQRLPLLGKGEATAVAALLDELAGHYPDGDLGRLTRNLAVRHTTASASDVLGAGDVPELNAPPFVARFGQAGLASRSTDTARA